MPLSVITAVNIQCKQNVTHTNTRKIKSIVNNKLPSGLANISLCKQYNFKLLQVFPFFVAI